MSTMFVVGKKGIEPDLLVILVIEEHVVICSYGKFGRKFL